MKSNVPTPFLTKDLESCTVLLTEFVVIPSGAPTIAGTANRNNFCKQLSMRCPACSI